MIFRTRFQRVVLIFAPMSMFHDIGFDELEVMFNEVKKYVTIVFFYLIPAKNR